MPERALSLKDRAPAEWLEGQRITEAVIGQIRAPFLRGVAELERILRTIEKRAVVDLQLNILAEVEELPLEEVLGHPMEEAWGVALRIVLRKSAEATLRRIGASFKASEEMEIVLANEFLLSRSSLFGKAMTATTREAVLDALQEGISRNLTIPQIAKSLREIIGLSPRQAEHVRRLRDRLEARGLKASSIERQVQSQRKRALRRRATTIARTETNAARNAATLNAWQLAIADGELPHSARKIWIANDPCPICTALAELPSISLNLMFDSPHIGPINAPPAHPNCKCSLGVVE